MIETFQKLCWRFCILVEETYGISECLITLHSLIHLPEDITRFSSPDNFWCFQFERAVGRYVKQSSNNKGIEKSFARKESQREFIKAWSLKKKQLTIASNKTGRYDKQKVHNHVDISIIFFPIVDIHVVVESCFHLQPVGIVICSDTFFYATMCYKPANTDAFPGCETKAGNASVFAG